MTGEITVADALKAFRDANNIPHREGAFWTCRVGPVLLRLPNFGWRKKAVLAHDIHHVLTETPCTMRRMPDGGVGVRRGWHAALGRDPVLPAACHCGSNIQPAPGMDRISQRPQVAEFARHVHA